jgi:hypothetical protein
LGRTCALPLHHPSCARVARLAGAQTQFCTREGASGLFKGDAIRHGEKDIKIFELWASLFADDCATLFESRANMIAGANCLYSHFLRFELDVHIGRGGGLEDGLHVLLSMWF